MNERKNETNKLLLFIDTNFTFHSKQDKSKMRMINTFSAKKKDGNNNNNDQHNEMTEERRQACAHSKGAPCK